ncbi:hypothetical protein H6G97_20935 [Nostoc flagelliforme FACHB-838]|uniref:HNH endonuclease n=1 Tax=Nostoc flagelliforme FACHB-838 TaxID=2692904 RepID=A0ABR8DR40_9NOSO|nr:hypothetical protein [Nostoc flagelliforme]MBD2531916.1 hypothetical protein [Nostoc flagelliforme FACHB-838]
MRKSVTKFEYASNWSRICRQVYKLQPRCSNNPLHGRATVVHHLHYRRSLLRRILGICLLHFPSASVSGYEIPGWDCINVCYRCHNNYYGRSIDPASVHHSSVWVQLGGLKNHQVWIKAWELRIKFWLLTLIP